MQMNLRRNAEERLKEGTAPPTKGWETGLSALTLLHRLASAPDSAGDALKLLHELQVHQVELDLQHEQIEQDRLQLTEALKHSTDLFDLAPFAYLTLDPEGRVMAANRAALTWLAAVPSKQWEACHIDDFLAPECRSSINDLLARLRKGAGRQTCTVQSRANGASAQVVATAAPGGDRVLMGIMPTVPAAGPGVGTAPLH